MAFLDNTGLSYLWDKIKTALSGKLDTTGNAYRAASIPFAQVDDTSTSTVFTATVPGITELRSGVCVFLMNGVVTSASGFTVNINGLGAKPVYSTLSAASRATTLFNVNYTLLLVYNEERVDGGCWDAYYGYDSDTISVQSVNGKTGSVVLDASDVGALDEIDDVIYDINAEFHAESNGHYFTFASGVDASTILAALNEGKLPIVRNTYGSLKRKWYFADYNNDGSNIYIQFFRETQFIREVMLYTESDGKAYIDSVSLSSFKRKPVTVWEVQDVTQGLIALNTNISSSLAWQLTNLDLTPFARIKIYVRAGRKTGSLSADSSITPASIIEMSLDDRAKETVSQNVFLGSSVVQNPNDPNRLGLITCAVSGDKTKFAVLRATTLYGTAATSNTDAYPYVFKIEGYYD